MHAKTATGLHRDTRENLRRKLPELQDRLRASEAIPIDTRQPLDQVADAILSHTTAGVDVVAAHWSSSEQPAAWRLRTT